MCRIPIDGKWVFDVKRDVCGHILRHKARLVARGLSGVQDIN